ncbi:MAG: UvrD-helicase domain-containing protein [Ruthenibacterium sp.]
MSEKKWTKAQQQAIDARGGTVLISAAAGSGKTAVLVERAVQLITDETHPVAADRLLIVTFTRAAAEELRGRIAVRLAEAAAENTQSVFLRRQRILLGRANISTIDAYCMQLLQRYFSELGIPPDFGLADDATAFTLRQNTLSAVLETQYADADFCAFASLYGRARNDSPAAASVLALYDYLRSMPNPHAALEAMCQSYETDVPLAQTAWGETLLCEAEHAVENARKMLHAARKIVVEEPILEAYDAALAEDAAFFDMLTDLLCARRWDDARCAVQNYQPPNFKAVRGYEGAEMDRVKGLRTAAKDVLKQMQEHIFICSEAEFAADRVRIAPMVRALARAVLAFETQFFAAKLDEKILEYSDFEHLALQLLCDKNGQKTEIARAISRGFDAVMVDEYQDTNALQALLYQCLANDDASNLFFVGDVKQSVYRFRLASPAIFIEKREKFSKSSSDTYPKTIVLGNNFRSAGNIISQINMIFKTIMSKTVGDVTYNTEEKLEKGTDSTYDGGPLELKIVDTMYDVAEVGDTEAVADCVASMVKDGFLVRGTEGTRPCRYEDFCVLLRTRGKFALYAAAFARRGIPACADTGESWLGVPAVSPLVSFLRVIDNPGQDIHLAATLLSPLFDFTPDDLTALRILSPRSTLFAALLQSEDEKARSFCTLLRFLRTRAGVLSVDALCTEIFAATHYFAAVGAMENGVEGRENLRRFTAFAAASAMSGSGGLSGFLRYVDSLLESGAQQSASAPHAAQGSVSIMTIHRSKGLEFPICILADAAHKFNLRDTANPVLLHPTLGIGFNLRADAGDLYSTAPHKAIRTAMRAEAVSEEMRILYVALTRAKDKLIVTFAHDKPFSMLADMATMLAGTGGADAYSVSRQLCFANWLCIVALLHPDCDALRAGIGAATLPLLDTQSHMTAEVVRMSEPTDEAKTEQFVRKAVPDTGLLSALLHNFAREDALLPLQTLPAKLSVSALSHKGAAPILARPAFLYQEGLTAAERGTAQHAFLQFANFSDATHDLQKEIARLVAENYLDATLAQKLPLANITTFLQSPLAKRMQNAAELLREYDFITAIPAKFVAELPPDLQYQPVLVQGIADAVLLNGKTAEIVDYKTDRGKTPAEFLAAYTGQLLLYRAAIEKRLGVAVTACTIYAFALHAEINVPLDAAENT